MLRFSSDGQVFLHAVAATATFGRALGVRGDDAGFMVTGGPTVLLQPGNGDEQACKTLKPIEHEQPFVLMVKRGGCTFVKKLLHATRVGATGVIVIGSPPDAVEGQVKDLGGLIRPSADGEPESVRRSLNGSGMVYVEYMVGEVVEIVMAAPAAEVKVEVMKLDEASMGYDVVGSAEDEETGGERREGKLALGEWDILNLRITERPP